MKISLSMVNTLVFVGYGWHPPFLVVNSVKLLCPVDNSLEQRMFNEEQKKLKRLLVPGSGSTLLSFNPKTQEVEAGGSL